MALGVAKRVMVGWMLDTICVHPHGQLILVISVIINVGFLVVHVPMDVFTLQLGYVQLHMFHHLQKVVVSLVVTVRVVHRGIFVTGMYVK